MAGPGVVEATPISFAQEDLWYASRFAPRSAVYNEVAVLRRTGPLDVDALRCAFDQVVRRHDAWRTTFSLVGGSPVQLVGPSQPIEFPVVDLREWSCTDPERDAARVAGELAGRPYDLEHGPTVRPLVVRLADDDHRIYLAAHHLVFDCLSLARVAVPELIGFYEAAAAGRPAGFVTAAAQYGDYTAWERRWVGGPRGMQRLEHWRRHLAGAAPLELPLDRPRREHPRFAGGAEPIRLPAALAERVRAAGQATGASSFQVVAAAFAVLMHRYTGQSEIVFATAVDLRRRRELEPVLGFAATWLAVRAELTGDPTFATVVRRLRDEVFEAVDMAIPFGQVADALHLQRGSGINPLLRALFVLNPPVELPPGWDLDLTEPLVADAVGATKFDLQIELQERATGEIDGRIIFDTDLFDRSTVRRLITAWPDLIEALVADVDRLPVTHLGELSRDVRDVPNGGAAADAHALPKPESVDDLTPPGGKAETGRRSRAQDASTAARLGAIWEDVLGLASLRPDEGFFDVGGTSLDAIELLEAIREAFGVDLPLSTLLEANTIEAMAGTIDAYGGRELPLVVLLKPGTSDRPVFLVHSAGGDLFELRLLASRLDTDRPVYGVRARGLDGRSVPHIRVEEMADEYIRRIRAIQPAGPYAVGGYSFGGLVAFEMARLLTDAGDVVDPLLLLDTYVDHRCLQRRSRWWFGLVIRQIQVAGASVRAPRRALSHLRKRAPRVETSESITPLDSSNPLPARMRLLREINMIAHDTYRAGPHLGHAVFFRAQQRVARYCDPVPVWAHVVEQGLTVEPVPGGHEDMLFEPNVNVLADRVAAYLS